MKELIRYNTAVMMYKINMGYQFHNVDEFHINLSETKSIFEVITWLLRRANEVSQAQACNSLKKS